MVELILSDMVLVVSARLQIGAVLPPALESSGVPVAAGGL